MKALYAEFTARTRCEVRVAALVAALATDARSKPGCLLFDAYTRCEQPRAYVVFEVYRDVQAFEDHLASLHSRRFNAALGELIEGPGSTLEWLDPVA